MTPAERAVIEAATILSDEGQNDHWTACAVVVAVEALRAERAAAEDMRPWRLVIAEDEIWSVKTKKWYRVVKTVLNDGVDRTPDKGMGQRTPMVSVTCEGMAKPFIVPAESMVKVRRSEMGQAVDVWAGIEVMSS